MFSLQIVLWKVFHTCNLSWQGFHTIKNSAVCLDVSLCQVLCSHTDEFLVFKTKHLQGRIFVSAYNSQFGFTPHLPPTHVCIYIIMRYITSESQVEVLLIRLLYCETRSNHQSLATMQSFGKLIKGLGPARELNQQCVNHRKLVPSRPPVAMRHIPC